MSATTTTTYSFYKFFDNESSRIYNESKLQEFINKFESLDLETQKHIVLFVVDETSAQVFTDHKLAKLDEKFQKIGKAQAFIYEMLDKSLVFKNIYEELYKQELYKQTLQKEKVKTKTIIINSEGKYQTEFNNLPRYYDDEYRENIILPLFSDMMQKDVNVVYY